MVFVYNKFQMFHYDNMYIYRYTIRCTIILIVFWQNFKTLFAFFFTCKLSAVFKKLVSLSCEICTSPRYINSSNEAIFVDDVPSSITIKLDPSGVVSNISWKCLLQAAKIILWALKVLPNKKKTFIAKYY